MGSYGSSPEASNKHWPAFKVKALLRIAQIEEGARLTVDVLRGLLTKDGIVIEGPAKDAHWPQLMNAAQKYGLIKKAVGAPIAEKVLCSDGYVRSKKRPAYVRTDVKELNIPKRVIEQYEPQPTPKHIEDAA